jgi:two-component system LytT family response regulator
VIEAPIRVVVVDDEPPARDKLGLFLSRDPELELVGEAGDGAAAVTVIEERRPDLVFLDIQMPELDGFAVIEALTSQSLPYIVFVTAHDDFALRAFEVRALDYLLKPYDEERFRRALLRAKEQIRLGRSAQLTESVVAMAGELRRRQGALDRLLVRSGGRVVFIRATDIAWFESAANYVKIHVTGEVHLLRQTLEGLLEQLDPRRFVRIHRYYGVNLDHVVELQPFSHGDYTVVLADGARLKLSRRYRRQLPEPFRSQL